jgi:hypothetical protein
VADRQSRAGPKTIADFRRDNDPAIRRNCAEFVELWRRIGVLKGDCVAKDGSKFKAVNSEAPNATGPSERVEKVDNLGRRYARVQREIQRLDAMEHAFDDAPDGQISLTDPDARAMATSAKNSGLVGYNVQAAVDTETHLIVTHEVTNLRHDRDQLAAMAKGA